VTTHAQPVLLEIMTATKLRRECRSPLGLLLVKPPSFFVVPVSSLLDFPFAALGASEAHLFFLARKVKMSSLVPSRVVFSSDDLPFLQTRQAEPLSMVLR